MKNTIISKRKIRFKDEINWLRFNNDKCTNSYKNKMKKVNKTNINFIKKYIFA